MVEEVVSDDVVILMMVGPQVVSGRGGHAKRVEGLYLYTILIIVLILFTP